MALGLFDQTLIVVRGGGDLASGVIYRLHRAGFPVVVTELETPLLVRRMASFGEAVYSGFISIEGVTARFTASLEGVPSIHRMREVPVVMDPNGESLQLLKPFAVVDGRMAKVNLGTTMSDASLVVALGPGFMAGEDCHAVIETNRGHNLGRAIYHGSAEPDTGEPGKVEGLTHTRVLRAPTEGHVEPHAVIGDSLEAGQLIAQVNSQQILAPFKGVLRGLIQERVWVTAGMKIGDLDPRAKREHCFTISDKSLAVGGGALEVVLAALHHMSVLSSHPSNFLSGER